MGVYVIQSAAGLALAWLGDLRHEPAKLSQHAQPEVCSRRPSSRQYCLNDLAFPSALQALARMPTD